MLQCIAIADEPEVLDSLNDYADDSEVLTLKKTFINHEKAKIYLATYPVDLIFIYLRRGAAREMEFYKRLSVKPQLIFICGFEQFAAEAFALGATDYLVIPFSIERFRQAASKARQYCPVHAQMYTNCSSPCLFVRSDSRLVGISFGDIEYIRGCDDYVKIFLRGKTPVLSHVSMKAVLDKLPADQFVRIHRSVIVPVSKITGYRNGHIFLDKLSFPIGLTFLPLLKKILISAK